MGKERVGERIDQVEKSYPIPKLMACLPRFIAMSISDVFAVWESIAY